jgi:hypothetical protein
MSRTCPTFSGNNCADRPKNTGTRNDPWLFLRVISAVVAAVVLANFAQGQTVDRRTADSKPNVEKHDPFYAEIIKSLDPVNPMRVALENGARGHGPHYSWMDEMKSRGIRHAFFELEFRWEVNRIMGFKITKVRWLRSYYDPRRAIEDPVLINDIVGSDFELKMKAEAESRAVDEIKWLMTRDEKKPKLACGKIFENIFDDERLPSISVESPEIHVGCKP